MSNLSITNSILYFFRKMCLFRKRHLSHNYNLEDNKTCSKINTRRAV
uniref:Uncharacterized protein n=1 Tax=Anguilla anguilla TaxID=7936 RepID=A0A0E9PP32_ANGAN